MNHPNLELDIATKYQLIGRIEDEKLSVGAAFAGMGLSVKDIAFDEDFIYLLFAEMRDFGKAKLVAKWCDLYRTEGYDMIGDFSSPTVRTSVTEQIS